MVARNKAALDTLFEQNVRDRISIAGFDNSTATIASIFAAYGGTTVDEKITR